MISSNITVHTWNVSGIVPQRGQYRVLPSVQGDSREAILSIVMTMTNRTGGTQAYPPSCHTSTSVGDVIEIDGVPYLVAGDGFERLSFDEFRALLSMNWAEASYVFHKKDIVNYA